MPTEKDIEEGLKLIKKRRRNLYTVFFIVIALAIILKVVEAPQFIGFFVITAGILVMLPMFRWLSLSTCPRCHGNYYGIIANIKKTNVLAGVLI